MVRPLRCMRGRHDWQRFEAPEGDVGRQCARCGELDWPDREPESHGPRDRDWRSLVDPG
jgi:hypothetical protein